MANIVVSSVCNLKCPFCFAGQFLDAARLEAGSVFISVEAFEERLEFLDRSGINEIRLIGGEPTLHPHFPELIARARQRSQHIVVFSHGLMPERAVASLEAIPKEACTVLVNMNAAQLAEAGRTHRLLQQRMEVLVRLGQRVLPGYTIYASRFDLDPLLAIIEQVDCRREIRVGLAQPILDGNNTYLHPKQYRFVGARLAEFARRAADHQVKLAFDCGFVRCMFDDNDRDILKRCGTDFASHCNPILDIAISGEVIHCFPLTEKVQLQANSGLDAGEMRTALSARTRVYRSAGIYPECSACRYKRSGECSGGCLGIVLRRFEHTPVRLQLPALPLIPMSSDEF